MSRSPAARLELTPAWLAEQYVVQRRTAQQIADAAGWSSQYVRDRLRECGIGLRPTGVHGGLRDIDRDRLAGWLDEEAVPVATIAARTGCSTTGIGKLCQRRGVDHPGAAPSVRTGPG